MTSGPWRGNPAVNSPGTSSARRKRNLRQSLSKPSNALKQKSKQAEATSRSDKSKKANLAEAIKMKRGVGAGAMTIGVLMGTLQLSHVLGSNLRSSVAESSFNGERLDLGPAMDPTQNALNEAHRALEEVPESETLDVIEEGVDEFSEKVVVGMQLAESFEDGTETYRAFWGDSASWWPWWKNSNGNTGEGDGSVGVDIQTMAKGWKPPSYDHYRVYLCQFDYPEAIPIRYKPPGATRYYTWNQKLEKNYCFSYRFDDPKQVEAIQVGYYVDVNGGWKYVKLCEGGVYQIEPDGKTYYTYLYHDHC